MKIAFNTQILANNKQKTYFAKASGVSRFAWNWGLVAWEKQYQLFKEGKLKAKPNGKALKKQLNAIKKQDFSWMYEVTKYAAQQPFINLQKAWEKFFKKEMTNGRPAGRPRFKKKNQSRDSFYVGGDQVKVRGRYVKVPNLGWVKLAEPVKYGGHINSMTISRSADKWFVSFSMDVDVSFLPTENQGCVGVDLGIKRMATLSRGPQKEWDSPNPLRHALHKLARYQRRLAIKVRHSSGYKKLSVKIARLHRRIANIRQNATHQLSNYLVKHFNEIVIEDLNVSGMLKNGKLARAIADIGFYELRRQLTYKSEWYARKLTIANRWYPSSKLCSDCGALNTALTLSDRVYRCDCGNVMCRDENASVNLEQYSTACSAGNYAVGDDGSALAA